MEVILKKEYTNKFRKSISNDVNKKVVILDPLILRSKDIELVGDLIIESFISIINLFINSDLEMDIVIGERTGWRILFIK